MFSRYAFAIFYIVTVLLSLQSKAFQCPETVRTLPNSQLFLKKMKQFEGRRSLGSCEIEIHICDTADKSFNAESEFAGDVLVKNKDGFERYMPIYFLDEKEDHASFMDAVDNNILLYRFKDKNRDSKTGKYEKWALQVRKTDSDDLNFLEIAYGSQIQDQSSQEHDWVVCGAQREKFYRKHPFFHEVQSWWTWITHYPRNEETNENITN